MKKGDLYIGLIILLVMGLLGIGYKIYLSSIGADRYVNIYVDDELYKSIKLTKTTDVQFKITSKYGYNVVHIYNEGFKVVEADCPNQDDVRQGFVKRPGISVICLPHHLKIVIEGGTQDLDGVSS